MFKAIKTTMFAAASIACIATIAPTNASAFGGGHFRGFGGGHGPVGLGGSHGPVFGGGHGPIVIGGGHGPVGVGGGRHWGGYPWGGGHRWGYYPWGGYGYRYTVSAPSCGPGFFLNYWGHCRPIESY